MVQRASVAPAISAWPQAVLTIDETTAHITASACRTDELLTWLRGKGIRCVLRRGEGVRGLNVIDFGDPSPAEERRIRAAFAAWRKRSASFDSPDRSRPC